MRTSREWRCYTAGIIATAPTQSQRESGITSYSGAVRTHTRALGAARRVTTDPRRASRGAGWHSRWLRHCQSNPRRERKRKTVDRWGQAPASLEIGRDYIFECAIK